MEFNFKSFKKSDIALIFAICYLIVIFRTAWIGDDAIFTIRSILNLLNGYGPNFNIYERVQSYTHPLWFLILSAISLITKNPFTAAYTASISISLISFWILFRNNAANILGLSLAGISILLSKSFIDYSTSGLENPLTHCLLLLTFIAFYKVAKENSYKNNLIFFTCASLLTLSRADAIIFILPIIFQTIFNSRNNLKKLIICIPTGLLPFIFWSLFSLFYYGSIFPNTAYAKLNTGIPLGELLLQGSLYYIDSIGADPITLTVIAIGIYFGFLQNGNKSIALGIIFYLAYILYIGGDFMSGRFFSAPFFLAIFILSVTNFSKKQFLCLATLLFILGISNISQTLMSNYSFDTRYVSPSGIADERGYYYQSGGLLRTSRKNIGAMNWPNNMKHNGDPQVLCSPALSTIDQTLPIDAPFIINCALADPLLSRLPINLNDGWRIGHYYRELPDGYKESISSDKNQVTDSVLHPIYDAIQLITRGYLWDLERIKTIFRFNFTDKYDPVKQFLKRGIELNQEPLSYFISKQQGLSGRENWGRWSDTDQKTPIVIGLLISIPKKFTLAIEAKGFSQNIGQLATIKIGGVEKKILLESNIKRYEIPFSLSRPTSTIEIYPPNPISPNEIDPKNPDKRKLGIGIKSITFIE